MPSLNQGAFIEQSIESVLTQSWPYIELVVADGGSADATLDILARRQAADSRLKWFSGRDKGPAEAVNKALRVARGTIIGWLNSDDLYATDAIFRAVKALEKNSSCLMVYGHGQHIGGDGKVIGDYPTLPPLTSVEKFKEGCFICQPTVFFRRTLFSLLGPLDEELKASFDFDYWLRAFQAFPDRIGFVEAVQAYSRLHEACITQRQRRTVALEGMQVLARHLGKAPPYWFLTYMGESFEQYANGLDGKMPVAEVEEALGLALEVVAPEDRSALVASVRESWRWRLAEEKIFLGVGPDGRAKDDLAVRHGQDSPGVLRLEGHGEHAQGEIDELVSRGASAAVLNAVSDGARFRWAVALSKGEAPGGEVARLQWRGNSLRGSGNDRGPFPVMVSIADWKPAQHGDGDPAHFYWRPTSNVLVPRWGDTRFGCAMSLGNFGHCAAVLRRLGLQGFAGPFDGLSFNIGMVAHCIRDDFALFLDQGQYIEVPEEEGVLKEANACAHRFYRDQFGLRFMFNHCPPTRAADHAYLERGVTRFRAAMNHQASKFLLLMTIQPINPKQYEPLLEALRAYGTPFLLVAVRLVLGADPASAIPIGLRTSVHGRDFVTVEFPFAGRSNGVEFAAAEDNSRLETFIRSFNIEPLGLSQHMADLSISAALNADNFDEAYYLAVNGDVAAAVKAGVFATGWSHYIQYGRQEGRPAKILPETRVV